MEGFERFGSQNGQATVIYWREVRDVGRQCGDYKREGGVGEVEENKGEMGADGDGRRLDLGGEHTTQYTDDVMELCT